MQQLDDNLRGTLPTGRIVVQPLPDCEEIRLGLIDPAFPTGPLPAEVMRDVIAEPAYWAFCWGSGLALARYLLANPRLVRGKRVVDFGSGSGVAGIAAALAGAREVTACDTDRHAREATAANARLNGVHLSTTESLEAGRDVVLMADVLYDKQNLPLLAEVQRKTTEVLVADSRVLALPDPGYLKITEIEAPTFPNLGEFDEYRTVHIFRWVS